MPYSPCFYYRTSISKSDFRPFFVQFKIRNQFVSKLFFYATIDELTVTNFLRNCRADCSLFQKQNETKRNFVTRRGSGKNWSAGSLIERTVARDARCPAVRAARFPTGFFLESMRIFFFDRRATPCDTRPWLIVMQMIFAQRRKRLATWTCSIYVHVHGKKIPERPRVSPTLSPRIWVLVFLPVPRHFPFPIAARIPTIPRLFSRVTFSIF